MAEFLGWHMGDGCISITSRYSEFVLAGDLTEEVNFYETVVIPTFNQLFGRVLKSPIKLKRYDSVGVCGIYLFDRSFVSYLQSHFNLPAGKKLHIKLSVDLATESEKKSFLRGVFDTDGSIFFCRSNTRTKKPTFCTKFHYKPKIKLAVISKELVSDVYGLLKGLGFSPRMYSPKQQRKTENTMYTLVLDTDKDVIKWIEEIGFKNYKHVTKVKIWKQFGFCPPHTTISDRIKILDGKLDVLSFYK